MKNNAVALLRSLPSLLAALMLLCGAAQAAARAYDDVMASGYIRFAIYRDFPPYSYLQNNAPAGVDVELGRQIAKKLGLAPRWLWLTADETVDDDLRNAIWKGDTVHRRVADVMLRVPYDREYSYALDGYGLPRNDMVVMMAPYQTESWKLARDLSKTGAIRNLAVFQYQPIGVETDSLPDFLLAGAYNGRLRKQLHHYNSVLEAVADLERGKLAAVAGTRGQLEWGLRNTQREVDIDDDGLEALGKLSWDIGIAVKQDHRQLGHAVEQAIHALLDEGAVASIFEQFQLHYQLPAYYRDAL